MNLIINAHPITYISLVILTFHTIHTMSPAHSPRIIEDELIESCKNGDREKIKEILADGRDPNKIDFRIETTPLAEALKRNDLEVAQLLVDKKANVNAMVSNGNGSKEPIIMKTIQSMPLLVFLVKEGANIDMRDILGTTPLDRAVEIGHLEAVNYLLESGAKVNAISRYGCRPLQRAEIALKKTGNENYKTIIALLKAYDATS